MDTTIIESYLKRFRGHINYTAVCAADDMPTSRLPQSTALIVNTMPHTDSGEHWVLFYLPPESTVLEYFDSYGRPPYTAQYQQFLRRQAATTAIRYVYNRYRLQGLYTSVCAHYCLTYLYCRLHHDMTMNDYVQLFDVSATSTDATSFNDTLVIKLFKKFYNR